MHEPQSNPQLQLPVHEMKRLGYKVVDLIVEHIENLAEKPTARTGSPESLKAILEEPIPEEGGPLEPILDSLKETVLANLMHCDHPRYFAYVPGPSNYLGVLADALSAGFNVFSGTWLEGSGPAQVELTTIDWLCRLFGLPRTAGGLFVTGGSQANFSALAVAREIRLGSNWHHGVVYVSEQAHSSVAKALRLLGVSAKQIQLIPCDEDFRLQTSELEEAIERDRQSGLKPFCIVATAGTTNTGAIDPLREIQGIAREQDLWFHVDAAYGGAAILHEPSQHQFEGISEADSITLDPHKWLFQPYECGVLLVRESGHLERTFSLVPEYLKDAETKEQEVNFYERGLQMTRTFGALKLWMTLKVFGLNSLREAVAIGIENARLAEDELRKTGLFEIITPAQLGIVTFRAFRPDGREEDRDQLNRELVLAATSESFSMHNTTILRGQTVVRFCTINPRTTAADIRESVKRLAGIVQRL